MVWVGYQFANFLYFLVVRLVDWQELAIDFIELGLELLHSKELRVAFRTYVSKLVNNLKFVFICGIYYLLTIGPLIRVQDVYIAEHLPFVLQNWPSHQVFIAVEGLGLESHAEFLVLLNYFIKVVPPYRLAMQVRLGTIEELGPPSEHNGNISDDIPLRHPCGETLLIVDGVTDSKLFNIRLLPCLLPLLSIRKWFLPSPQDPSIWFRPSCTFLAQVTA